MATRPKCRQPLGLGSELWHNSSAGKRVGKRARTLYRFDDGAVLRHPRYTAAKTKLKSKTAWGRAAWRTRHLRNGRFHFTERRVEINLGGVCQDAPRPAGFGRQRSIFRTRAVGGET